MNKLSPALNNNTAGWEGGCVMNQLNQSIQNQSPSSTVTTMRGGFHTLDIKGNVATRA